ncbi:UNVERIFIED_ORG: hypothetical protein BCL66_11550 [Martelella mediterranea]
MNPRRQLNPENAFSSDRASASKPGTPASAIDIIITDDGLDREQIGKFPSPGPEFITTQLS